MTNWLDNLLTRQPYRSILCLNGDLPDASFFAAYPLPLIAADGAADALAARGLWPDQIIGDLDSVSEALRTRCPTLALPDQNTSDFQKCLQWLQAEALLPAIIVGIQGGALDHILNNISLFVDTDSLLYAPPLVGFVLSPGKKSLTLPTDTKLSLLGMPETTLSTRGLKWNLQRDTLCFPGRNSCFNRVAADSIELDIQAGQCLTLIYLETTSDAGSE